MNRKWFVLVLGLQVCALLGSVAVHEKRLREGKSVLLETQPVDPRDLLRGDYITLSYKISNVPRSMLGIKQGAEIAEGAAVYALLEKQGQFHAIKSASFNPLKPEKGQVLIAGRVDRPWGRLPDTILVTYGIERFYVAEGKGNPRGKLAAEAVVSRSGVAQLKEVYVDGKPYAKWK